MSWILSIGEIRKTYASERDAMRYIMNEMLELLHDPEYHNEEDKDQTLRSLDDLKQLGLYPDITRLQNLFNGTNLFKNNLGELHVWYSADLYDSCDCPSFTDLVNDVLKTTI